MFLWYKSERHLYIIVIKLNVMCVYKYIWITWVLDLYRRWRVAGCSPCFLWPVAHSAPRANRPCDAAVAQAGYTIGPVHFAWWVYVWFGPPACTPNAGICTRKHPGSLISDTPGETHRCNVRSTCIYQFQLCVPTWNNLRTRIWRELELLNRFSFILYIPLYV